jgi:hypothetical protein
MADRDDLEFTYSLIDRIFRLSLGELADFSGAKYDGDFSLSLEEAQRRKHEYVAEQIGIGPGRRVLDLGCGWGPLLDFVRRRGGAGVGVTLSSGRQFPGSMLPFGQEQIIRSAEANVRLIQHQRPARLHRNHPPVAGAVRGAEPQEDAAQAPAAPSLADERRFPARVHLGRECEQRLLRARAAGPRSARIRERGLSNRRELELAVLLVAAGTALALEHRSVAGAAALGSAPASVKAPPAPAAREALRPAARWE